MEDLLEGMSVNPEHGLTQEEVSKRNDAYGYNVLTPPPQVSWWYTALCELFGTDGFALPLWLSVVLSIILYFVDTVGLEKKDEEYLYLAGFLVVLIIITAFFTFQRRSLQVSLLEGYTDLVPQECEVLRNGLKLMLDTKYLVPGDIVYLQAGDKIPADLRILQCSNFYVDSSSLTGACESQPRSVACTDDNPMLTKNLAFLGTVAQEGSCKGVVILIGDDTVLGRLANLCAASSDNDSNNNSVTDSTNNNSRNPTFEYEISSFVRMIITISAVLITILVIISVAMGYTAAIVLLVVEGLLLANLPTGTLAAVTVSFNLSADKMMEKQVVVKNSSAIDTVGCATCIITNKTGILTQNHMTVSHVWFNGKAHIAPTDWEVVNASFDPMNQSFIRLVRCATLCNRASFEDTMENMSRPVLQRTCVDGDATEYALIKFTEPLRPVEEYRQECVRVAEIPFSSSYKYHVSINVDESDPEKLRTILYIKGAPEVVFKRCSHIMMDGEPVRMTSAHRQAFADTVVKLGSMGERVLGFAERVLSSEFQSNSAIDVDSHPNVPFPLGNAVAAADDNDDNDDNEIDDGLVFTGLISLIDPPRASVTEAIGSCKSAFVKVIMITGDFPITAKAVARQVGLIEGDTIEDVLAIEREIDPDCTLTDVALKYADPSEPNGSKIKAIVITGDQLNHMTDSDLDAVLRYDQILCARATPEQKLLLVEGCQRAGHIVIATGSNVEDAPALKKADVGVAMGLIGSDVAKDSGDLILMNDDFSAIVDTIEEGRSTFESLKKTFCYNLTTNIPTVLAFVAFVIAKLPLPLTIPLILCIDLGANTMPAIALAHEKPENDIMLRPPRNTKTDRLISWKLFIFAYLQIGAIQACAGFYAYMVVLNDYGFDPSSLPKSMEQFEAYPTCVAGDEGCTDTKVAKGTRIIDPKCPFGGGREALPGNKYTKSHANANADGIKLSTGWLHYDDGELCPFLQRSAENPLECYGCPYGVKIPSPETLQNSAYCVDVAPIDDDSSAMVLTGTSTTLTSHQNACGKPTEALKHAQTGFFAALIIVQWANAIICKTRILSISQQGMSNWSLNVGLVLQTSFALCVCYVPLANNWLGTRPLVFFHWTSGIPWAIILFLYDEFRKGAVRQDREKNIQIYGKAYPGIIERWTHF